MITDNMSTPSPTHLHIYTQWPPTWNCSLSLPNELLLGTTFCIISDYTAIKFFLPSGKKIHITEATGFLGLLFT